MSFSLAPFIKQQFLDSNGNPLAGGKLYTYQSATTTPQSTYTDYTGGTPNSNPVILDSSGRASVWLDVGLSYKFVLKDSSDNTIYTEDGVNGLLTNNSVPTSAIQDLAVTTAKLADAAVTSAKLASDASVDANRPVNTNNIRDVAVTRAKLAAGAVGTEVVTAVKTSTYSITSADDVIPCSVSGGAFTVTLPTAVGVSGKRYTIKRTDQTLANALTIATTSAQTIDGATTRKLMTQYESVTVESDGSNWYVVNRYIDNSWQSYAPTFTALGTVTSASSYWRRIGSNIEIKSYFITGTPTAPTAGQTLPSGLTTSTIINVAQSCGFVTWGGNGATCFFTIIGPSVSTINFSAQSAGSASLTALGGSSFSSSTGYSHVSTIPISSWEW
jgi:hypothetical protein